MGLEIWLSNGWVMRHTTSAQEITDLFEIIERDLGDCGLVGSPDWRFSIAYNAALKCCLIPLYCEGYRPSRSGGLHYRAIQSLSLTMGESKSGLRDFLEQCRSKRNISDYERSGLISDLEANELVNIVESLRKDVLQWVKEYYPEYVIENQL